VSESNRYGAYASLLDLSHYCGMTPQIRQYLKGGEQLPVGDKTPRFVPGHSTCNNFAAISEQK